MTSKIIVRCIDRERVKALHKLIGKDVSDHYIDSVQVNPEGFINSNEINDKHYTLCFRVNDNLMQGFKNINKNKILYFRIEYNGEISSEVL